MSLPIGLQMYTLREETAKDFIGTLEYVAGLGYDGVEFAGFGGMTAEELKSCLDRLGLKSVGSHTPMDQLLNNLDEVIEYNLKIGTSYIICPYAKYENKDDFVKTGKQLNEIAKKCNEKGLKFCYHNHAHEFVVYDGEYGLDILYKEGELVKAEMDTFWVKYAGLDPVEYVKKYSGRCPLIHLKDMEDSEERAFAEVGNGIMDIKSIMAAGEEGGAKWFIVEQDRCKRPAKESVKISIENLKKINQ